MTRLLRDAYDVFPFKTLTLEPMAMPELRSDNIADALRKTLDRHGYGFQYAVLEEIKNLQGKMDRPWDYEAAEFPVRTREFDTRIDFIWSRYAGLLYLICECKVANRARSNWCFVKAPYITGRSSERVPVWVEEIAPGPPGDPPVARGVKLNYQEQVYHLGFPVRSGEKGNTSGQPSQEIENAATQVMKGVYGCAAFFADRPHLLDSPPHRVRLLPVIFSTARIWTTDAKLNEADIATGRLDPAKVQVTEMPWVWLQYHVSPGLKHELERADRHIRLPSILEAEYARAIGIVSPSGIEQFMSQWFPDE